MFTFPMGSQYTSCVRPSTSTVVFSLSTLFPFDDPSDSLGLALGFTSTGNCWLSVSPFLLGKGDLDLLLFASSRGRDRECPSRSCSRLDPLLSKLELSLGLFGSSTTLEDADLPVRFCFRVVPRCSAICALSMPKTMPVGIPSSRCVFQIAVCGSGFSP